MMKMIPNMSVKYASPTWAKEFNEVYAEGYRFMCDGDYTTSKSIDPWSGMPEVEQNAYFFDTYEEAEAFAEKQKWVFNPDIHSTVYKVPEYTETWEEVKARQEAEKAAKKAKRAAAEKAKADAAGMTVEEYKKAKAKKATISRLEKEIAEMEKELARKKSVLEKMRG